MPIPRTPYLILAGRLPEVQIGALRQVGQRIVPDNLFTLARAAIRAAADLVLLDSGPTISHCKARAVTPKKGKAMERIDLPLSDLTPAQKLELMEAIWEDLAKHEENFESPSWHEQVLKDREEALAAGKATVSDWNEAKRRIRENASCEGQQDEYGKE